MEVVYIKPGNLCDLRSEIILKTMFQYVSLIKKHTYDNKTHAKH